MAQVIHGEFGTANVETQDAAALLKTYSIASLNLSPKPGDVEGNLRLAERAITEAKRAQPDLEWVVLPELFTCAYSGLASVHLYAEDAERGERPLLLLSRPRPRGTHSVRISRTAPRHRGRRGRL